MATTTAQFKQQYPQATEDDVKRFLFQRDVLRYTHVELSDCADWHQVAICGNEFTAAWVAKCHFTGYEQMGPSTWVVWL